MHHNGRKKEANRLKAFIFQTQRMFAMAACHQWIMQQVHLYGKVCVNRSHALGNLRHISVEKNRYAGEEASAPGCPDTMLWV